MLDAHTTILTTPRLVVRFATTDDAPLFYDLWTNPQVMVHVGFPQGLPITVQEIHNQILGREHSPFTQLLVVALRDSHQAIGECHMSRPNEDLVCTTDVKLHPKYWGQHFGVEVKRGLLHYLFNQTDCLAVEATPNKANLASIKMQEAVGGVRIGEGVFHFPESMTADTVPVPHYIYRVYRDDWQQQQALLPNKEVALAHSNRH
jgi:RimJ/RimL family protein N-acetyltransferase